MGGKTSTTTQQVKIPPEVLARYNAVNTRAEGVAQNPFQIYGTDPSAFVAQLNQQQGAGIERINQASGAYQPYFDTAAGAASAGMAGAQPQNLDIERFLNPYQQQVIDATMRQMGQANEQAQSGALGTAVSSGAFGGDRAGIAAANLANQQGLAMGSTLAGLNAQNYQQALDAAQQQQGVQLGATQADLARLMQGGQFYAGLGQAAQQAGIQGGEAQINAGTLGQQTEQAGLSALYNQFMQQQAYPFQVAQFLANIAMGTGALSGSTTVTTQPTPFFSDRRLKEDVRRIGHTDDGLPIYKFKYKGDDSHQTHIGFMADEVEQVKPEAVGVSGGYKTVDYDRATKANGGGVAGPYGASFGSENPYGAGYVPQAVLPVGELMVADSAGLDNSQRNFAQQLDAASRFGENMVNLKENFGKEGEFWKLFDRNENYRGGVVNRAMGGPAYLQKTATDDQPVQQKSYLADTVESQEKDRDRMMSPSGMPNAPQSTLGQIGDAAKSVAAIASLFAMSDRRAKHDIRRIGKTDHGLPIYSFKYKGDDREQTHIGFMADEVEDRHPNAVSTGPDGMKRVDYDQAHKFYQGGVVRSGYQDGGPPRMTAAELLAAAAEGNMPQAARERFNATEDAPAPAPAAGVVPPVRPAQTPMPMTTGTGLSAAEMPPVPQDVPPMAASPRPQPRPAGLVPAPEVQGPPVAPAAGQPVPLLGGVVDGTVAPQPAPRAPAGVAGADPSSFYRTQILRQESGYRQFDENGNPLTSPKGAVGIGQVMEGTGPEAAKLAGLEWDRDRWLNDPEYNAAIGEAYFLEQYRRFGSLDKAAAAYNAGPGALASAMDRASALGGSYLDYLPEETQNYVLSTAGGAGVSGGAPADRDARGLGAGMLASDTPYEERSRLGQMAYDRDGRLNKDFILSALSGLGTMASSPSLYLGSAMLQGLGGFANTYSALEQRRGEIGAKNLENMRAVAMDTMQWNELNGTNLTPAQYARMNGITLQFPETATAQDILSGAYTPTTESGLEKLDYRTFQDGSVDIGGRTVRMQDDPVSLQRFIQDNNFYGPDTPIGRQVQAAKARLDEINASGGMTVDARTGEQFQIPGYVAVGDVQAQAAANREATAAFRAQAPEVMDSASRQIAAIAQMKGVYQQMEAGSLAGLGAQAGALLSAIDPNNMTGWQSYDLTDPAQYQIALKGTGEIMSARLAALPGGAPAASIDFLQTITPGPDMQPAAIKKLLAIAEAEARYKMDLYNSYDPAIHGTDIFAYQRNFAANGERFQQYVDDSYARMPKFAGEGLTAQDAPDGSTSTDAQGRPIIKRNGQWVYQ